MAEILFLLHKQLVIFLALCLPVMFLQILGVSSLLMGWNTEYAHDTSILDIDELGTFKDIPLFPTLFVGIDDLNYSIGQGRPVGLLHSNNVLSIFVSIAACLNLVIKGVSLTNVGFHYIWCNYPDHEQDGICHRYATLPWLFGLWWGE